MAIRLYRRGTMCKEGVRLKATSAARGKLAQMRRTAAAGESGVLSAAEGCRPEEFEQTRIRT